MSFPRYGVSVRYPPAWAAEKWCWTGVHELPIVILTASSPGPKCAKPQVGVGASFPPPQQLSTNDVTVAVSQLGSFAVKKPKWKMRIAGQPANMLPPAYGDRYDTAVACPAGARREYRLADIRWPHALNTSLEVEGVICGPDLAAGAATFGKVLNSIRFTR